MKATGIIRRIDDLGRVIIPKEIRRTLHIDEGDPLEIFVEDGRLMLAKYYPSSFYADQLTHVLKTLADDADISAEKRDRVDALLQGACSILREETK